MWGGCEVGSTYVCMIRICICTETTTVTHSCTTVVPVVDLSRVCTRSASTSELIQLYVTVTNIKIIWVKIMFVTTRGSTWTSPCYCDTDRTTVP